MCRSRTVSQAVLSLARSSPVSPLWMNCPLCIPSTSSYFLSSNLWTHKLPCYLLEYINGTLPTLSLFICRSSSWNIPFRSLPGWPLLLKLMSLFKCHLLGEALSVLDGFFILHWPRNKKSFFVAPIYNCFILLFIIFPSHVGSLEWNIVFLILHQILVFITSPRNLCLFATSVNTHAI